MAEGIRGGVPTATPPQGDKGGAIRMKPSFLAGLLRASPQLA